MKKLEWKAANQKERSRKRTLAFVSRHAVKHGRALPVNFAEQTRYANLMVLFKSIHTEVDPVIRATNEAWEKLGNGVTPYLENSPETYGMTTREVISRYYRGASYVPAGKDCDCELDDTSRALVETVGHTGDVEKPL